MYKKIAILGMIIIIISQLSFYQTKGSNDIKNEKRLALVIGNADYIGGAALANPINDARAMKEVLMKLGFVVMEYENLNQSQMKRAIDDFGNKLAGYDVGLFYYSGHGIQAKGNNYLIPVDAQLNSEEQVEYDCVRADRTIAMMEVAKTKTNIIILDACRDNPFERSWTRSSSGRGFTFIDAPSQTLIAYSTAPGRTASDGTGKYGLYTEALLENLIIPNITIIKMFQNVRATVSKKSENKQIPWESTSLTGDFILISVKTNMEEPIAPVPTCFISDLTIENLKGKVKSIKQFYYPSDTIYTKNSWNLSNYDERGYYRSSETYDRKDSLTSRSEFIYENENLVTIIVKNFTPYFQKQAIIKYDVISNTEREFRQTDLLEEDFPKRNIRYIVEEGKVKGYILDGKIFNKYEFNNFGSISKEKVQFEDGNTTTVYYKYIKYDSSGNWLERLQSDSEDFKIYDKIVRTIDYY
jgi:hypothetical protein